MVDKEKLLEEAKLRYPVGCKVDQKTAYNGEGGIFIIKSGEVQYCEEDGNIAIGGIGIYNKSYNKWAEIVEYPKHHPESILQKLEIW